VFCALLLAALVLTPVQASATVILTFTSQFYTSLDGGITQEPVDITRTSQGSSRSATWSGGQSDQTCFGPGLSQCFTGVATTDGQAFVDIGVLKLEWSAEATASPTAYGPPFVIGQNPWTAVARGGGPLISFSEDVTLTHPTLPVGSPVSFLATVVLDAFMFGNAQANLQVFAGFNCCGTFPAGGGYVQSFVVNGMVGDVLPVGMTLTSGGQAAAGFSLGRELDSAGFRGFNSANLYLDAQTPGLEISSPSQHDWSTPPDAPEPEGLLAGALLVAPALRRRR
jgi:MYXO-CTERM domain-containing protein